MRTISKSDGGKRYSVLQKLFVCHTSWFKKNYFSQFLKIYIGFECTSIELFLWSSVRIWIIIGMRPLCAPKPSESKFWKYPLYFSQWYLHNPFGRILNILASPSLSKSRENFITIKTMLWNYNIILFFHPNNNQIVYKQVQTVLKLVGKWNEYRDFEKQDFFTQELLKAILLSSDFFFKISKSFLNFRESFLNSFKSRKTIPRVGANRFEFGWIPNEWCPGVGYNYHHPNVHTWQFVGHKILST